MDAIELLERLGHVEPAEPEVLNRTAVALLALATIEQEEPEASTAEDFDGIVRGFRGVGIASSSSSSTHPDGLRRRRRRVFGGAAVGGGQRGCCRCPVHHTCSAGLPRRAFPIGGGRRTYAGGKRGSIPAAPSRVGCGAVLLPGQHRAAGMHHANRQWTRVCPLRIDDYP
jgi:hypothetical protein